MFHRLNTIVLATAATAAMIAAMAGPASARPAAGTPGSRAPHPLSHAMPGHPRAATPGAGPASTPVPVDVTGDITWTNVTTSPDSTGGDTQSGTVHVKLTNVNGTTPGDNTTYSISNSMDSSGSAGSNCTWTQTGSSSGSGALPLGSVGTQDFEFGVGTTFATATISIPYDETDTVTYSGTGLGCTGSYSFDNPGWATPICYDQGYSSEFPGMNGTFVGTYPNGTVNIACSGTAPGYAGGNVSYNITGTLTITPSCSSASSSSRARASLAASSACGLAITSPPDNSIIAATDGNYLQPQPGPGDRQPEERQLTVTGSAPPGDSSITLNGQQVPVNGEAWTATIPVTNASLGQLTLTASDANASVEETITLIDLWVTSPTEDTSLPITAEPAMPGLNATVSVPGYPGDTSGVSFDWTLEARGEKVTRAGLPGHRYGTWNGYSQTVATGTTNGTGEAWQPSYDHIVGGIGRLSVKASLPGVVGTVTSEPRWIGIPGTNPPAAVAKGFVDQSEPNHQYADTIRHIICVESNWEQFSSAADGGNNGQPPIPSVPSDWNPNPGPGEPLYGHPADIGIAQLSDPPPHLMSPDQYWNWQENLLAGITLFHAKIQEARTLAGSEQHRLASRLAKALQKANQNLTAQGLPTITKTVISVPALTDQEVIWQAIRLYNGYKEFHFDADYVLSSNGLNVNLVGTKQWVGGTSQTVYGLQPSQSGHWGKPPTDLSQRMPWTAAGNQGYVDTVLNCKNH